MMNKDKKVKEVYVITTGEYSSYRIETVLLDKKEAKEYAEYLNNEFEYGEYIVEKYKVGLSLLDSRLERLRKGWRMFHVKSKHGEWDECVVGNPSYAEISTYCPNTRVFMARIFAPSEKAALKIASEKRAKAIAEHDLTGGKAWKA